ncbi:MAG: dockerin type I repeat-containing protein [Oscillospiraceae bacterium]|nr:dockerin type I repeat-containing protein [Oscillospiraceae bacterium]
MKLKGKKAIMSAALSAIVAAGSLGSTAKSYDVYDYFTKYTVSSVGYDATKHVRLQLDYYVIEEAAGIVRLSERYGLPGETITITVSPDPGTMAQNIYISVTSGNWDVLARYDNITEEKTIQYTIPNTIAPGTVLRFNVTWRPIKSDSSDPTPTPTPTPDPTPTLSWKKGDANCNGKVNAEDATAVLKHLAGIIELSYIGSVNADMDQNGKVTAADATAILKFLINEQ